MVVQDILKGALELCGVVAGGEAPAASDSQTALKVLNMMLDSWATENLALHHVKRDVFELVPSQGQYTIGLNGTPDFQTLRPMSFLGAAVGELRKVPIYGPIPEPTIEDPDPVAPILGYNLFVDVETPVEIIQYQKWISISDKSITSAFPTYLYQENTAINETIHLWPVPNHAKGLVLYSKKALSQIADAGDDLDLPPGYAEALELNLFLKLAPRFGKQIDPVIYEDAKRAKGALKVQYSRTPKLVSDVVSGKPFNLISGE